MELKLNQVVLHLLDPGASEPVLSDRAMDMDADLYEYYTATLERAFASDEVKNCRFLPDSAFAAEMAQNNDFIDLSRRIAGVIFGNPLHGPRVEEIIQKLEAGEDVDKQAYVDEVAFAADDTVTKVTIDGTDYDITPITQEIIDGRAY